MEGTWHSATYRCYIQTEWQSKWGRKRWVRNEGIGASGPFWNVSPWMNSSKPLQFISISQRLIWWDWPSGLCSFGFICSTIAALPATDILHLWTALALAAYSSSSQERNHSRAQTQPASASCSQLACKAWLRLYIHSHTKNKHWSSWKIYYTTVCLTTPVQK